MIKPGPDNALQIIGFTFAFFVILYQYLAIVQIHAATEATMARLDTIETLLLERLRAEDI